MNKELDAQKQLARQVLDVVQRTDICPAIIISIIEKMMESKLKD